MKELLLVPITAATISDLGMLMEHKRLIVLKLLEDLNQVIQSLLLVELGPLMVAMVVMVQEVVKVEEMVAAVVVEVDTPMELQQY